MNAVAVIGALAGAVLFAGAPTGAVFAADSGPYPARPIRMMLGFDPGASVDVTARVLGRKLSAQVGVAVLVENKPGAGGLLVLDLGAKAAPDGYTLIFNSGAMAQSYALLDKPGFHPQRDFAPVSLVSKSPMMLLVNPGLPVNTPAEFIAYARARPGQLSYSSAGTGNISHIGNLLFQTRFGIEAVHVPYKGGGPGLVDLMAGRIQFTNLTVAASLPHIKSGKVRALAVAGLKRSAVLPDVPTLSETVLPGFESVSWLGVIAPAKTAPAIVQRLSKAIAAAMDDPEVKSGFALDGSEVIGSTPEEYAAFIQVELDKWTQIIRAAGIKLE